MKTFLIFAVVLFVVFCENAARRHGRGNKFLKICANRSGLSKSDVRTLREKPMYTLLTDGEQKFICCVADPLIHDGKLVMEGVHRIVARKAKDVDVDLEKIKNECEKTGAKADDLTTCSKTATFAQCMFVKVRNLVNDHKHSTNASADNTTNISTDTLTNVTTNTDTTLDTKDKVDSVLDTKDKTDVIAEINANKEVIHNANANENTNTDVNTDINASDMKPNANSDVKPNSNPDEKTNTNPDVKPHSNADEKTNTNSDMKPNSNLDEKTNANPDVKPHSNTDEKINANSDVKPDSTSDVKPNSDTNSDVNAEANAPSS